MKKTSKNKISVIGAGSWGTAIASILCSKNDEVVLWGHRREHIDILREQRENIAYLPGFRLPHNLTVTDDLEAALKETSLICMVVPSQVFRSVFLMLLQYVNKKTTVVSAVKGIENESLMTMAEVMDQECKRYGKQIEKAVLSGPSFAKEVIEKHPTAVTIGAETPTKADILQQIFVTSTFRVYGSTDIVGLEISAAFKNIIAIAAGICDGLGYGLNTRAALITRGLAEISRIGMKKGADPLTFSGLSGMGDLILTCTGDLSRNRQVGLKLAEGKKLETILKEMRMVAEGVKTTLSGYKLAEKYRVDMPILNQMYQILYQGKDPSQAVKDLLSRELKIE